jgi:hypothetical protein
MARRFGGRFSPQSSAGQPLDPARAAPRPVVPRHPLQSRTRWITVMAVPFLLTAFGQDPAGLVAHLLAFGAVAAGMGLTREGLQAEAEYDARPIARRPAIPRKLFGGVLTGLGLAIGSYSPDVAAGAGLIGLAGLALHWLAFGADPMRDKGMEGVDSVAQDRAHRLLAEAEAHLSAMQDAILRTGDRRLEARLAMFAASARALFSRIEQAPGDASAARRYLGVYLQAARDATVKFADLYAQTRDPRARQDYETMLTDLETRFEQRREALVQGDRVNLDIEIGVLRERLEREAPRPDELSRALTLDDLLIPRETDKTR